MASPCRVILSQLTRPSASLAYFISAWPSVAACGELYSVDFGLPDDTVCCILTIIFLVRDPFVLHTFPQSVHDRAMVYPCVVMKLRWVGQMHDMLPSRTSAKGISPTHYI